MQKEDWSKQLRTEIALGTKTEKTRQAIHIDREGIKKRRILNIVLVHDFLMAEMFFET